jgi:hypothetical protein
MPFTKGHKIWLGKQHTKESKELMSSKFKMRKPMSKESRKRQSETLKRLGIRPPSRKGIKASIESRLKISLSKK